MYDTKKKGIELNWPAQGSHKNVIKLHETPRNEQNLLATNHPKNMPM